VEANKGVRARARAAEQALDGDGSQTDKQTIGLSCYRAMLLVMLLLASVVL